MIKDLQISLYDIFGYIIPGFVAALALGLLFSAFFAPTIQIANAPRGLWGVTIYLIIAYVCGHGIQSVSNMLGKFFQSPEDEILLLSGRRTECPTVLVEASRKKLAEMLNLPVVDLEPRWLYRACDAAASNDQAAERDLYTYREGFYRGMATTSLVWLTVNIVLLGRQCVNYTAVQLVFSHGTFALNVAVLIFALVGAAAATYLFFVRYRRFAAYRVSAAVLSFVFSPAPPTKEPKPSSAEKA